MLDERKLKVLYAIIENYTLTAEPVGSKTLLDKYDLGVSSATIRNDMGVLEDLGFIEKTHTSSGRVPSNKAYKFYVQKILEGPQEQAQANKDLITLVDEGFNRIEDLLDHTTRILSDITKYTALAVIAYDTDAVLRKINLSKIDKHVFLLVLVFSSKDIVHETFVLRSDIDEMDIARINKLINQGLGISLSAYIDFYNKFIDTSLEYSELYYGIASILYQILKDRKKTEFVYDGLSNIFKYPEYQNTSKAKSFLDFLEDSETIKNMLMTDKENDKHISVRIGQETSYEYLDDISIISSSFDLDGNMGLVGILGPTRMDYNSVILSILSISSSLKTLEG